VYQVESKYRYPDAFAALDDWTCGAERNKTNFCSASYDALVQRARREPDLAARERLYASAEQILSGEQGAFPAVPIFWPTYENLESLKVRASFSIDPLGRIDLSLVHLRS
jgi:ABC-type oligopeptide transport system substrate-binding subunit